jgi:hypothetical protein
MKYLYALVFVMSAGCGGSEPTILGEDAADTKSAVVLDDVGNIADASDVDAYPFPANTCLPVDSPTWSTGPLCYACPYGSVKPPLCPAASGPRADTVYYCCNKLPDGGAVFD